MDYKIGSMVFDKWEIKREIGHGSFGTVYEIEKNDFGIRTKSALKVIKIPHDESDVRQMLTEGMDNMSVTKFFESAVHEIVREIEIMSQMKACENVVHFEDHSVIVRENEIGWDILIRMELLSPLTDKLVGGILSESEVVKIGIDVCKALVYCQRKGIIHRDIKAENIFINENGDYKLGDFGVAKSMDKTSGGSKKGSENYMAPEVYLSKPYNRTVDIYSLGILLYRLMNYNRPPLYPAYPDPVSFADRENALIERMQGAVLPNPATGSEQFANIILKACSYKSEDRYQSAAEMLSDLKKLNIETEETAENVVIFGNESALDNLSEKQPYEDDGDKTILMSADPVSSIENVPNEKASSEEISSADEKSEKEARARKNKTVWIIYIAVVLLVIIGVITFFYYRNTSSGGTKYHAMLCFKTSEMPKEIRYTPWNFFNGKGYTDTYISYPYVDKCDSNGHFSEHTQGKIKDVEFDKDGTYSVSITDLDPDNFNGVFETLEVELDIPATKKVTITLKSVYINGKKVTIKAQPETGTYEGYYVLGVEDIWYTDLYDSNGIDYPNVVLDDDDVKSIKIVFTVDGLD